MSTRGGSPGDPADAKRSRSSVGCQGATSTHRLRRAAIGRCLEARPSFAPGASSTDRGSRCPYRPPDEGKTLVTRAPRLSPSQLVEYLERDMSMAGRPALGSLPDERALRRSGA